MTVYNYEDKNTFIDELKPFYNPVNTLLEIGCGIRPTTDIQTKVHICVEPHKEYIDVVRGYCPTDAHYVFINADALSAMKNFADSSVDTVCMIDLIEHLEKNDGFDLIKEADRIARKQVVVFTPLGFFPQEYHEGDKDAWGLDGAKFQEHKSGWMPEDFGEDWDFHICEKFHIQEELHIEADKDYGAFFAIKNKNFEFFEDKISPPVFVKDSASPDRKIKSNPLVSVVMPVYNGEKYLKDAIDSVLKQTYQNIEVIVVNDGSTDNTEEIIKLYGDKIKYFKKENGGVATALNIAVKNAKGDYISWLSHDDLYESNKIERQINELKSLKMPSNTILFSGFKIEDLIKNESYISDIEAENFYTANDKTNILKVLFSGRIHGCTLLIPKKAFLEVDLFDENLKTTQDYNLWYKFLHRGYKFSYINEPLVITRHHKEQGTIALNKTCEAEGKELIKFAIDLFYKDIAKCNRIDYKLFRNIIIQLEYKEQLNKLKKYRFKSVIKNLLKKIKVK